eukprot:898463-Amorphochlora_amoeboformis.AAC.1
MRRRRARRGSSIRLPAEKEERYPLIPQDIRARLEDHQVVFFFCGRLRRSSKRRYQSRERLQDRRKWAGESGENFRDGALVEGVMFLSRNLKAKRGRPRQNSAVSRSAERVSPS